MDAVGVGLGQLLLALDAHHGDAWSMRRAVSTWRWHRRH